MRAYLFFSQGDGTQDRVETLQAELKNRQVEAISLDGDSVQGSPILELYDITQRPAVVVTRDDGQMVHRWLGMLPDAGEVSYYAHS